MVLAAACEQEPADECGSPGEPTLVLAPNRLDTSPIEDGSQVPVFPPPQGGVFTELDLTVHGTSKAEFTSIRVTIVDADAVMLADQRYDGDRLPAYCNPDGSLFVRSMPVAFADDTDLYALEGVHATLGAVLEHPDATVDLSWSVTLRVTQ